MQTIQSAIPIAGIVFIVLLVLAIIGVIIYVNIMRNQPSSTNLGILVNTGVTNAAAYPKNMPNRKGLNDYLLSIGNLSADQLAISNFHVMTANLGGFFTPVNKAAFCKEAIQYSINAGARCIIFDIWPDTNKGANLGPILKVCANDSDYTRLSYYTLDLATAFTEVRKYAFEDSANPASNDPMILYLRFRGKPVSNTFSLTAMTLASVFKDHRLPFNFATTNNNPLYSTPINTSFPGKIIILSDQAGTGTSFAEWVNNPVAPNNSPFTRKTIATPGEVHSLTPSQLSILDTSCTTNLMACAPLPEDIANSESNAWDWKQAQNAGIQFCGLNLWVNDNGLKAYLDPVVFGTYSFLIKSGIPPSTTEGFASRYTIERVPPPITVKPLGYGNGTLSVQ